MFLPLKGPKCTQKVYFKEIKKEAYLRPLRGKNISFNNFFILLFNHMSMDTNKFWESIINYPTVCLWVCGFVTELLPNEGSNLNK